MIYRIIAGTIICFFCFNASVIKFFDMKAFTKASIAAFIIGPILGFLSYKGKKAKQKSSD